MLRTAALIQDQQTVTDQRRGLEIMGDEKAGHVAANVPQQFQYLHLYRDIQRAHGLVQHQKGRSRGQRPRDAGPLHLAAAEFMRQTASVKPGSTEVT